MKTSVRLTQKQIDDLLKTIKARFENHPERHKGILWDKVQTRLLASPDKMISLYEMETTGGEPDLVGFGDSVDDYVFYDCSAESPKGRRSLCYDRDALDSRKEFKPKNSAVDMAAEMGIEILSEAQYRQLQTIGRFDLKTSSWVKTPPEIRKLGGACFCDRRYEHVFMYHNGAESYYASRGFRGSLKI